MTRSLFNRITAGNRWPLGLSSGLVLAVVALGAFATSAFAAAPAPRLAIQTVSQPSSFSPADNSKCEAELVKNVPLCDGYQVTITNVGSVATEEAEMSITDTVPAGLLVQKVSLFIRHWDGNPEEGTEDLGERRCATEGSVVHCTLPGFRAVLQPDDEVNVVIYTTVEPGATVGATNLTTVSGAGAPEVSSSAPEPFEELTPFGLQRLDALITAPDGTPYTQAGGHPYEFRTTLDPNTAIRLGPQGGIVTSGVQDVKDIAVDLPLGLLGDALATPKCTLGQLESTTEFESLCPPATKVGRILTQPKNAVSLNHVPIYNLVPEHGVAAEFGFLDGAGTSHVLYATVVPTPAGYVLRTTSPDITQINLTNIVAVFYGDPSARDGASTQDTAMFTNPSDCSGRPLVTTAHLDSWQEPGATLPNGSPDLSDPRWASQTSESPPVTGCDLLRFEPEAFSMLPDTSTADAATGMTFDLKIPQPESPVTLATPPLKDATVTLPAGVIVNPASAGGLASCTEAQVGWLGGTLTNFTSAAPECPDASKVGSVELTTPLIAGTLVGTVYLAAQNENPFHSLLAGYIVVDDPTTGTLVKIPGILKTDPSTGQITGTFDENPQLPFSELKLRFFGGVRGELATPESCGTFTTTSALIPWSSEEIEGHPTQVASPSSSFPITSGCTPGFAPAFTAGTTNPQAGGYTPFTLSFSRGDTEQELSGLTVTLPPGLVGKLAGISQCSDAQLAAAAANPSGAAEQASPECPANSRIGSVQSSAGVGSQPFSLGGTAYLTGPYKGAPYGVAVVVPALAGPFDLGNVVVRSKLNIDPTDAHVTVTSDAFPTIIDAKGADGQTDGFPIRLRSITVTMDRPSFTLNPTSCAPLRINATLTSTSGTPAAVSSHFQAGNCSNLAFKTSLAATVGGKASKSGGASLNVKVIYPSGSLGTYANIKSVKVDLPKQLPSRLTTLQKACLAATFEANPANCSPESDVGMAVATTPLLSSPLMGPAYLVSHGGEAFPDLEIVLQGEGIKLVLVGNTKIKNGITSSTFKSIPDAPVSGFDLKLPTGKFSILGANVPQSAHYSLCGQKLAMPTEITGQNGAVLKQSTKIGISGCAKHKQAKKHRKLKKHKKTRKG